MQNVTKHIINMVPTSLQHTRPETDPMTRVLRLELEVKFIRTRAKN